MSKIINYASIAVIILLLIVGAYTYPKPTVKEVKAEQPSLEQLKKINDEALEKVKKDLKDKEIEAQILDLKKQQESLKVQS
jgi:hypothetical protein